MKKWTNQFGLEVASPFSELLRFAFNNADELVHPHINPRIQPLPSVSSLPLILARVLRCGLVVQELRESRSLRQLVPVRQFPASAAPGDEMRGSLRSLPRAANG